LYCSALHRTLQRRLQIKVESMYRVALADLGPGSGIKDRVGVVKPL